ncbi:MAG TPA: DinB family protein [Cytophagales bacterium]|nr:DinB family protein [Cytophagales bacterium]
MIQDFIKLYDRDLNKLSQEIEAFKEEQNIWKTTGNIKNSSGNLCLHLIGNLSTFICKNLGGFEYTRDREAEFNSKDISRDVLLKQIQALKISVNETFKKLQEQDLEKKYPENLFGYDMTTGFFLIHLAAHLSYHLGQINYLRRILEE